MNDSERSELVDVIRRKFGSLEELELRKVLQVLYLTLILKLKVNKHRHIVIVPYRGTDDGARSEQLEKFIKYFQDYVPFVEIVIVEQGNDHPFNRGMLLNIGVLESKPKEKDIVCFHDVDLLPEDNLFHGYIEELLPGTLRHLASSFERYSHADYLGGALMLTYEDFQKINGFPTNFWGWGGEDDEFRDRVVRHGIKIEKACGDMVDLENLTWDQKKKTLDTTVGRLKGKAKTTIRNWHRNNPGSDGISTVKYTKKETLLNTLTPGVKKITVDFDGPPPKVAFLFLTEGDINHPKIWEEYFRRSGGRHSVVAHPKNYRKVTTPWLRNASIEKDDIKGTVWGHLTNAYIQLLRTAMIDPSNKWFIFVSDSCLPCKNFDTFYNFLNTEPDSSYIHKRPFDPININKNKQVAARIGKINLKHSGWYVLSRKHAKALLAVDETILKNYNVITAGDEHLLFSIYNTNRNEIKDYMITHVDWEWSKGQIDILDGEKEKVKNNETFSPKSKKLALDRIRNTKSDLGKHPRSYSQIDTQTIKTIKDSGAFFFRKVPPNPKFLGTLKYSIFKSELLK